MNQKQGKGQGGRGKGKRKRVFAFPFPFTLCPFPCFISFLISNLQSIEGKRDAIRQERGVACVFDVVRDVRQVSAMRFEFFNNGEGALKREMRRVRRALAIV